MSIVTDKKLMVIRFIAQGVYMCIPIENITKALPILALEKIPSAPNYIAGLMNLEGRNIPVIDAALRAGINRTENYTVKMSILLCNLNGEPFGLIVDEVIGLAEINKSEIQMNKEFEQHNSPFAGSIVFEDVSNLLLNIHFFYKINLTDTYDNYEYASKG